MPKIAYKDVNFQSGSLDTINLAIGIVEEYEAQGYDLTLRQLYYQLVARGYIENNERSYKRIGNLINDARLAGLIDWLSITDRTRNMKHNSHWTNPKHILRAAINQYAIDTRENQPNYIEVWVEKEALVDVVGKACSGLDVPFFACRGYVSQSEMWAASRRFHGSGKDNYIIHLGDHDPSGVDMTRDTQERMEMFGVNVEVRRIALNFNQVEQYNPPPNPAKITDSRAAGYISSYGRESWELDALNPATIKGLIEDEVFSLTDEDLWYAEREREQQEKTGMRVYIDKLNL
jgi:hypothetical protein